jgi:hypothetical protein
MFENFEKIGDEIYLYKNFLSEKESLNILNVLENLEKNNWTLNKFNNILTAKVNKLDLIYNKLNNILSKELYLPGYQTTAMLMEKGQSWPEHYDADYLDDLKEEMSLYKDGLNYLEKDYCVYGSIVYLNDFEGGEIYYPKQNIEYKPNNGDLIIHSSEMKCMHGVKSVKSNKRYTYANLIYKKVRVPI